MLLPPTQAFLLCLFVLLNSIFIVASEKEGSKSGGPHSTEVSVDNSVVRNMSATAIWNSKTVREDVGWKIVFVRNAHIFLVDGIVSHNPEVYRSHLTGHNLMLSHCPIPHESKLVKEDENPTSSSSTSFLMLKLATTGSTWIGDLLEEIEGCKFHAELITGSDSSRMTDKSKVSTMTKSISNCHNTICGFSINSKASANLDFPKITSNNHMRTVVWIRSNMVAYTIGLIRAGELRSGPCHTNNVRLGKAEKCELPLQRNIPVNMFKRNLRKGSLYNAVNLGAAFSGLKCKSVDKLKDNIYELYYESMLADKEAVLKSFVSWLGHPELMEKKVGYIVPKDKTVKVTSASLKDVIENYDEIHAWLKHTHPCYLSHLESDGKEIMPLCPLGFDPTLDDGLWSAISLSKSLPPPPPPTGTPSRQHNSSSSSSGGVSPSSIKKLSQQRLGSKKAKGMKLTGQSKMVAVKKATGEFAS